tara:strand:- start:19 stop:732 length:714 start_codon:yes stop_codon:yes gene_type:complete
MNPADRSSPGFGNISGPGPSGSGQTYGSFDYGSLGPTYGGHPDFGISGALDSFGNVVGTANQHAAPTGAESAYGGAMIGPDAFNFQTGNLGGGKTRVGWSPAYAYDVVKNFDFDLFDIITKNKNPRNAQIFAKAVEIMANPNKMQNPYGARKEFENFAYEQMNPKTVGFSNEEMQERRALLANVSAYLENQATIEAQNNPVRNPNLNLDDPVIVGHPDSDDASIGMSPMGDPRGGGF